MPEGPPAHPPKRGQPSSGSAAVQGGASSLHRPPVSAFASRALGFGSPGRIASAARQAQRAEARAAQRIAVAEGLLPVEPVGNRPAVRRRAPPKHGESPEGNPAAHFEPSGLSLSASEAHTEASKAAETGTEDDNNNNDGEGPRLQPEGPSSLLVPPADRLPQSSAGDSATLPPAGMAPACMAPPLGCPEDDPHAAPLSRGTYLTGGSFSAETAAVVAAALRIPEGGGSGMGVIPKGGNVLKSALAATARSPQRQASPERSPQVPYAAAAASVSSLLPLHLPQQYTSSAASSPRRPPHLQLPQPSPNSMAHTSSLSRTPGATNPAPLSPGKVLLGPATHPPPSRTPSGRLNRLHGRGHHLRALRRTVDAALRQVGKGGGGGGGFTGLHGSGHHLRALRRTVNAGGTVWCAPWWASLYVPRVLAAGHCCATLPSPHLYMSCAVCPCGGPMPSKRFGVQGDGLRLGQIPPLPPSVQSGPGTKRPAKVPSAIPIRELLASANDVASYWTMQRHHMPNHVMLRYDGSM